MKKSLVLLVVLMAFIGVLHAQSGLVIPPDLEGVIPWDLEKLAKAPEYHWEDQTDSVWSLKYEGEKFEGKSTTVFAYYASPNTIKGGSLPGKRFPAVVLIHGGGGTAFRVWALAWAQRGYAAIAMDLGGSRPASIKDQDNPWGTKSSRLPLGGPPQGDENKFFLVDRDFTAQWQFHAVSNIISAHSLIRSFGEVDANKTAMTGISWGGYLTNLVAGIDHRFKAAVPVYGSGFLHEGSAWDQQFDSLGTDKAKRWVKLWDPSQYVGHARIPMLFVNGTNDFAYFVENWYKTAKLAKDHRLSLIPEMKHSHSHGAAPEEIYYFIRHHLENGPAFAHFDQIEKEGGKLRAKIKMGHKTINAAFLVYTKDEKRSPERKWERLEQKIEKGSLTCTIPEGALLGFLYLIDDNGLRISSPVIRF